MTDKRKDEMPERIYAELNKKDFELPTKVWFSTKGMGTEYIRADLSPPVPDDVAVTHEMIVAFEEAHLQAYYPEKRDFVLSPIDSHQYNANKAGLISALRAASTPSAEVEEVTVEYLTAEFGACGVWNCLNEIMRKYPNGIKIKAGGG